MALSDFESCVILNMLSGIGASRFEKLTRIYGSPADIFTQSTNVLAAIPGIGAELADRITHWERYVDLKRELDLTDKAGVDIISCCDPRYPQCLKELGDFPLCLYVRGQLPEFNDTVLAIVGSRRVTRYGRRMAEVLSTSAAQAGWTVVSGLAFGIDAIAHQACVDAKGKTVAVLGGGLMRIHPQDHIPLAQSIIENGALLTEFPMEFQPNKTSFPMRNRIISGLSRAVLVVEAGFKSGSLITANFALEQGRSVFAVPGMADSPQSRGCHALIKQGAKLTESFDDIIEDFEFLPGFADLFKSEAGGVEESSIFSDKEKQILASLEVEEKNIDHIATETAIGLGELLPMLMKLEMKRIIRQEPGKIFSLVR